MISDGVRNVTTPRLGLNQPSPGGDIDVWGDYLNANMTILDQSLLLAGGLMSGPLSGFTGGTAQNPSFAVGSGVGLYPMGASMGVSSFSSQVFSFSLAANTSFVPLNMNNSRVYNLPTPTSASDATNQGYVDAADALRVLKTGDTMNGTLTVNSAGGIVINNPLNTPQGISYGSFGGLGSNIAFAIGSGTLYVYQDGIAVTGLLGLGGGALTGPLDMGGNLVRNLPTPLLNGDAANKAYVDANSGGGPGGGIPEAPNNGPIYGRGGATPDWVPVLPLSGAVMTGPITGFAGNAQNPSIMTAPGIGLYPLSGTLGVTVNGTSCFLFSTGGNVSQVSLNMFNQQINNLAAPTANNHAVTLGYLLNTYRPNYSQLPPAVQQVPVTFSFPGQPPANAVINMPVAMAITVPALSGNVYFYTSNPASANRTFTLNQISGGVTTQLGTITVLAGASDAAILSGAGGSLGLNDTLQLVGPSVQDASLADFGFTVMTTRT